MSGHSKWSTIKRKKGAVDAKRGKIFTKIAREIMVAAKDGGGDPDTNPRLRAALTTAKAANMPKDNQERAIKKGTGDLEGVSFENLQYEGRGPQGVSFIAEVLTDNKNRTVAELRHMFHKSGGEMVSNGAVTWQFDHKGVLEIEKDRVGEDALMELALNAGAEDIQDWGESWGVLTDPSDFTSVQSDLESLDASGDLRWLPKAESTLTLQGDAAVSVAKF
ncbi:MAG: YebC/PmpR family DNA-binding transcriptional regulator, partial [Nannocystaceae bacterium]